MESAFPIPFLKHFLETDLIYATAKEAFKFPKTITRQHAPDYCFLGLTDQARCFNLPVCFTIWMVPSSLKKTLSKQQERRQPLPESTLLW